MKQFSVHEPPLPMLRASRRAPFDSAQLDLHQRSYGFLGEVEVREELDLITLLSILV